MNRTCIVSGFAIALVGVGLTTLADAAQIGPSTGVQTTMNELKKQGYKCEVMGAGSWVCSKPGSPDYYCMSGICDTLKQLRSPATIKPKYKSPRLKVSPS